MDYHKSQKLRKEIEQTNVKLKDLGAGSGVQGIRALKVAHALRRAGDIAYKDSLEAAQEILAYADIKGETDLEYFIDFLQAMRKGIL